MSGEVISRMLEITCSRSQPVCLRLFPLPRASPSARFTMPSEILSHVASEACPAQRTADCYALQSCS